MPPGVSPRCPAMRVLRNFMSFALAATVFLRSDVEAIDGCAINTHISGVAMRLEPWGRDSVRFRAMVAPAALTDFPDHVHGLLPEPLEDAATTAPSCFVDADDASGPSLTHGNIRAHLSAATGEITLSRVHDGAVLLRQHSPTVFSDSVDGDPGRHGEPGSVTFTCAVADDEYIVGLGQHRTGSLNNIPFDNEFQLSQIHSAMLGTDIMIPFHTTLSGYGMAWNMPSFGHLTIEDGSLEYHAKSSPCLDVWFTTAPAHDSNPWKAMMRNYVDVTGHALPLPPFASGFFQSKNRYRTQKEVLSIVDGYATRRHTLSVMVVDYNHWLLYGDWDFTRRTCWPDATAMIRDIQSNGQTKVMVSVWPFAEGGSVHRDSLVQAGLVVRDIDGAAKIVGENDRVLVDVFDVEARSALWAAVNKGYLTNRNVTVFWLDGDEPERGFPDESGQYYYGKGQWRDLEVGMAFPLFNQMAFYDGLVSAGVEAPFTLCRSAWLGSQRYGAAVWSGDIDSSFEELAKQIPAGLNIMMSGVAYWTTDIGGYAGGDGRSSEFRELLVRWFQYGAFCPLFRLHGLRWPPTTDECGTAGAANEIWSYGVRVEMIVGSIMQLRESLRPYVHSIAEETVATGVPMMRPMFVEFPDCGPPCMDAADDQFMFGPDWLVAPVTVYNATNRTVYLPQLPRGQMWTSYYTDVDFDAAVGQHIVVETPLESFPLFVRRLVGQGPIPKPAPLHPDKKSQPSERVWDRDEL